MILRNLSERSLPRSGVWANRKETLGATDVLDRQDLGNTHSLRRASRGLNIIWGLRLRVVSTRSSVQGLLSTVPSQMLLIPLNIHLGQRLVMDFLLLEMYQDREPTIKGPLCKRGEVLCLGVLKSSEIHYLNQ